MPDWLGSEENRTTGTDFIKFLLSTYSTEQIKKLVDNNAFEEAFTSFMQ